MTVRRWSYGRGERKTQTTGKKGRRLLIGRRRQQSPGSPSTLSECIHSVEKKRRGSFGSSSFFFGGTGFSGIGYSDTDSSIVRTLFFQARIIRINDFSGSDVFWTLLIRAPIFRPPLNRFSGNVLSVAAIWDTSISIIGF